MNVWVLIYAIVIMGDFGGVKAISVQKIVMQNEAACHKAAEFIVKDSKNTGASCLNTATGEFWIAKREKEE